jgi:hypothetical protein
MKRRGQSEQASPESGFALLFIYALAATIAITLLMELPRVAFEAQRDREQLLIDRGEQYSRAIQLYVRKFNRYPPDFDALDNTQNLRFLRQHYVDPMTGKDEWRLIHVGPGGVFTDSLIYTKKTAGKTSEPQNFITEAQQVGGNQVDSNQAVNLAGRIRPSDLPGAPGDPNNPQVAPPSDPGVLQPQPQPGLTPPGLIQPNLPQFDANGQIIPKAGATVVGPNPPPGFPGQLPNPAQPVPPLPTGVQQLPNPLQTAAQLSNGAPAGAALIGQLLTTPRPGGLNGLNGPPAAPPAAAGTAPAPAMGQIIGGGIAGVASKREQEGIKVYKDKTKYNEWEFVYDITKDTSRTGVAAQPQQPQQQSQQPQQANPQPQMQQPQMQQIPQQMTPPAPVTSQ